MVVARAVEETGQAPLATLRVAAEETPLREENNRIREGVAFSTPSLYSSMSDPIETDYGIKKISATNWQQPDKATMLLLQITAVAKTEKEWVEAFLRPVLNPKVPKEIVQLMEVARGAMILGWYFYPLATLGAEQCWRIMDTGVRLRCDQAGIPTTSTIKRGRLKGTIIDASFKENVDALVKQGIISSQIHSCWDAIRNLRNSASHPARQTILDSWQALDQLNNCVMFLNCLFP
jgi:hypothetical protein